MKGFLLTLCTIVIVSMLIWTRPDTQAQLQPLPPARVLTGHVRSMDILPLTTVTGKLQPSRKSRLHFELSGRVTVRNVEPGQQVSENSVLLQIEDGDFSDAVEKSQALLTREQDAVERDRSLLDLVVREREVQQRELQRLEKLGKKSLASESRYDEVLRQLLRQQAEEAKLRYSVDSAKSRLKIQRANLKKAERNLQRTRLTAPFNSTVNKVAVEVGDYVSPGQVAIELVQLDELDLYVEVTGAVAANLHLGERIDVLMDEDRRQGRIIALNADPDPNTNTHGMRIRLPADGLYPGKLAQAALPGALLSNALVVPLSAVLHDDGQAYLFQVQDERVLRRPVKLIQRYRNWQVIHGINPDTVIVTRDVAALADGQAVTVDTDE
ncbi:MAG: efflux RND transporter periplasmic adaptor subunit [Gammaproteobacteria bacterium]